MWTVRTATASASGSSSAVGGIVAGFDQGGQVARDEDGAVVGQQRRLGPHDLEEPGDVLERLLGGRLVRLDQPGQQAAAPEEAVEQLPGRALVGHLGVAAQVRHQPVRRVARLRAQPQDPGLALQLVEDRPDGAVAAAGHVDDGGQVLAAERVGVGRRERVQVHAGLEVRHHPQEGEQHPDLGPRVQARRSGEAPRDAGHVQGAQDRVGMAVGPDQDGVVARRGAGRDPPADLRGDPVRLLRAGREDLQADRRGRRATIAPAGVA